MVDPSIKTNIDLKRQKLAAIREVKKKKEAERLTYEAERKNIAVQKEDFIPVRYTFTENELQGILEGVGISPTTEVKVPRQSLATNILDNFKDNFKVPALPTQRPTGLTLDATEPDILSIKPEKNKHACYTKCVQTDENNMPPGEFFDTGSQEFYDEFDDNPFPHASHKSHHHIPYDDSPSSDINDILTSSGFRLPPIETKEVEKVVIKEAVIKPTPVPLTETEREHMIKKSVAPTLDRTYKLFARALAEEAYVNLNYNNDAKDKPKHNNGEKLILERTFTHERLKNTFVASIDCSEHHNELIVTAYDRTKIDPSEPGSIVNIWNMRFKNDEPEYSLYSPTKLTCAAFGKFNANIIIGGCYSGQICMWDTRDNRRTPIHKSPVSLGSHTHPICRLKVIGSQNANNIVTISAEGRLCSWSLENLSQPAEILSLNVESKPIASNSLSFFHNDSNNFVVGGEDGQIYSGNWNNKNLHPVNDKYNHFGPISAIDTHKAIESARTSALCLTGSLDWSVKLWNVRDNKLLYHFDNHSNYVTDVAWSPVHPAIFVSTDADGKIYLWNINEDVETPTSTITLDNDVSVKKVLWSKSGQHLLVGDTCGNLHVYGVDESLYTPKQDEWDRLDESLSEAFLKCQEKIKLCPNNDNQSTTGMSLPSNK
uniref:WD_REPEATS_REGION domain-containing protein n=1 Tax=Parastrongyloides trichosuri TaxID=131310 RepID=A0A0N4ZSX6_PARTI